ncbi:MAG: hypothetical protein IPN78_12475 [Candidatus Accumulibacter sp.]|nr:hypothetical protein [Candidatus Accumulibacter propinquus]
MTLYDQPAVDRGKLRVAGPFTVETLQSYEPLAPEDVAEASLDHERMEAFQERVFEHLKTAGVKNGARDEMAVFARVDALPPTALLHAGYYDTAEGEQKAYIHLGPQFAPVSRQAVNDAVKACRARGDAQWLLILGFAFESDVENSVQRQRAGSFRVDKVRMHDDLLRAGLTKKDRKAATFVTIGEPDIALLRDGDTLRVEIRGLDLYDPIRDEVKARSVADIAYWMVDDDYDGSSFAWSAGVLLRRQPGPNSTNGSAVCPTWRRRARARNWRTRSKLKSTPKPSTASMASFPIPFPSGPAGAWRCAWSASSARNRPRY